MSEVKMLTAPVPNVPWQDRPAGPQNGARSGDTVKTQSLEEIR